MAKVISPFQSYFSFITGLVLAVVAGFALLAAIVPQWMVTDSATAQSLGLFKSCLNHDCKNIVHPPVYASGTDCSRKGYDLQDRLRAGAAFWILSLIIHFVAVVITFIGVSRKILFQRSVWIAATAMTAFAWCGYLLGLMIPAISLNHWLYCGHSFCDAVAGGNDCGYGFSFVAALFAVVLGAICLVLYVIALLLSKAQHHHNLRVICGLAGVAAVLFAILAVATPHWFAWNTSRTSTGLFSYCTGSDCKKLTFPSSFSVRTGCTISGKVMRARYDATAAFLFIACILSLATAIAFFLFQCGVAARPAARGIRIAIMGLIFAIGFFICVAMIIYGHTMNSYMKCGIDYCEGIKGCGYGFSFAISVIAIITLAVLLILHLFEYNQWLCFKKANGQEPISATSSPVKTASPMKTETTHTTTITSVTKTNATVQNASGRMVPLPSGGDWVFDDDSSYYWSDSRGLFWDVESEMFYNPDTEDWFA